MKPMWERRALQLAVALGGLVPVCAGLAGAALGPEMIPGAAESAALDSHHRYLSGLLLGIGLGFWSAIPSIERRTARVRLLGAVVVVGGLARVLGLTEHGWPGVMGWALVMELAVTPLLVLWQGRVARLAAP
ncbi:MAG TPA: DUF4345 domain-containing protein [Caulobacteraceae bacterium]|nr:DUF4345 domain-containing protein [Caulobacteraceae bacterium]